MESHQHSVSKVTADSFVPWYVTLSTMRYLPALCFHIMHQWAWNKAKDYWINWLQDLAAISSCDKRTEQQLHK